HLRDGAGHSPGRLVLAALRAGAADPGRAVADPLGAGAGRHSRAGRHQRHAQVAVREQLAGATVIREAEGLVAVNLLLAGLGAGALLVIGAWRAAGTAGALVLSPFTGIALYVASMPPLLYAGFAPTPQVLVVMTVVALVLGVALDRRRHAR